MEYTNFDKDLAEIIERYSYQHPFVDARTESIKPQKQIADIERFMKTFELLMHPITRFYFEALVESLGIPKDRLMFDLMSLKPLSELNENIKNGSLPHPIGNDLRKQIKKTLLAMDVYNLCINYLIKINQYKNGELAIILIKIQDESHFQFSLEKMLKLITDVASYELGNKPPN